jgi:hypothetical protein
VPTASAPARRRPWLAIAGGAAVAAVAALVAIVLAVRGGSGGDTVEIAIESDPPGAAILQGDKILGYTPMTYRFLRENKLVELTAQMVGYDIACFTVNPAEESHLVHVRMPDPGGSTCRHH